jgi:hypothetical protein
MRKTIKRILKEEFKENLLDFCYNKMVQSGLVDTKLVNKYNNNFEVYGFEGVELDYFMDNYIKFESGGGNTLFLDFQMYEEEIDHKEALEVIDWLYPRLEKLFEGDGIDFFDNLDDEY